ncbi:proline-rich protein 2-like [Agelaius tricolor]|uniref:proline-rich protein 2-like n=1 Tax=Agelaius tricolor TaxID=9191 RepID=UPI0039F216F3
MHECRKRPLDTVCIKHFNSISRRDLAAGQLLPACRALLELCLLHGGCRRSCHAELRPSCGSAPRHRESPAGHAPHFPIGRRRSGTRGPARPCRPAPRPRGPDTRPPRPRPTPGPSHRCRHPRLCHPVGPGCPGPRPSIPPTGVTGPAPSCRRRSPPPPPPPRSPRVQPLPPPPHVPLAPFADTAGPVLAQVPSLLLRLCRSLRLPDLRCRALLARPRCAPCGRCRGKLCPPHPPPAFQRTPHTPSCPRTPRQCKRPRLTPSLPAFRRNPPAPARHRLRWDRSAPARPARPCRRRGVRTGGCSPPALPPLQPRLCRACRRSSAASAVPAAAPAPPLPCLPPLQPRLCRACRRSSPASRPRRPCPPGRQPPQPPAAASRGPPRRLHAAPPATPGSSPADEAAPPPPVVAFPLLPLPLHGGRSRAFPSAAPRFRAAGWRSSAASCNHGGPGVPFHGCGRSPGSRFRSAAASRTPRPARRRRRHQGCPPAALVTEIGKDVLGLRISPLQFR